MSKELYYNDHYLYCQTGPLDTREVTQALQAGIDKLGKSCTLRVNVVSTREGLKGCTYIFVSDIAVANALRGLNFDGSERCEIDTDPSWSPPTRKLEEALSEAFDRSQADGGIDWADFSELEDDITAEYNRPTTKRSLPSLVLLPEVALSPEQQNILPKIEEYKGPIVNRWRLEIVRAYCYGVDEHKTADLLSARDAPTWITAALIRGIFAPYNTSGDKRKYPGVEIEKSARGVNILVAFDPATRDASFALLMTRKVTVSDGAHSIQLFFDHPPRSRNYRPRKRF